VNVELNNINEELTPLLLRYEHERERVEGLREYKRKLEQLQIKMDQAKRNRDLALAADLQYGAIPDLEKKIAQVEEQMKKEKRDLKEKAARGESMEDVNGRRMLSDVVGVNQIASVVAKWTGIPVSRLTVTERERLLSLAKHLHERVVGQDEAVEAVSEAVLRNRAGLSRPNAPIGSFLFLGPTGVGKTELAKSLAAQLFDSEKMMVRLDMSEYSEQHSAARLIGAPPGYVGFEQGGQLTEAVRRNPYTVILFDEIEKAHHQIQNVLLQLLDEGRLTDGRGNTVNFSNAIIIFTSNLGAADLIAGINPQTHTISEKTKQRVLDAVRGHFRPEFINRLDDIVVFQPLQQGQMNRIAEIQLKTLADRLADNERDITLTATPAAIQTMVAEATAANPEYGARPLKRYIDKYIATEISRLILRGTLLPHHKCEIDCKPGESVLQFIITSNTNKGERRVLRGENQSFRKSSTSDIDEEGYDSTDKMEL
jgi:ATP-dependent Clp protease ATP-binding subunit ClpB